MQNHMLHVMIVRTESSLMSQTFTRKMGRSGDISVYALVTLPESGKDQSDKRSLDIIIMLPF